MQGNGIQIAIAPYIFTTLTGLLFLFDINPELLFRLFVKNGHKTGTVNLVNVF